MRKDAPAQEQQRARTGIGPKVRYRRANEEPLIVVFPDDVDGIDVLERCFKEHGMSISPESANLCDEVLRRREGKSDARERIAAKERVKKTRWKR